MNKVLFSRNSDNWATPKVMYDFYIKRNYFDPCPLNSNFDGLYIEWKEKILLILHIVKLNSL